MSLQTSDFEFWDQICPKRVFWVGNGKSEHHHSIVFRLSSEFLLKLTSLIFWTKFTQKSISSLKQKKWRSPLNLTEVLKVVNSICPPIMKTFFWFSGKQIQHQNIPRNETAKVRTVRYGLKTALYRAPQLWSLVPADLKSLPNVNLVKSKIKHWECTECPCKLCKTYLKI